MPTCSRPPNSCWPDRGHDFFHQDLRLPDERQRFGKDPPPAGKQGAYALFRRSRGRHHHRQQLRRALQAAGKDFFLYRPVPAAKNDHRGRLRGPGGKSRRSSKRRSKWTTWSAPTSSTASAEIIDEIRRRRQGRERRRPSAASGRSWCPRPAPAAAAVTGYISIMEGCDNFCSYCIVPFTRGREKYRPLAAILREAENLAGQGFQEIVLLGQNVNHWHEAKGGRAFPELLRRLAGSVPVPWIRFITSYPGYHDRELIRVMAENRNIARHIHFPAQSGSTRILKKMRRTYTRDQYLAHHPRLPLRHAGNEIQLRFHRGLPRRKRPRFPPDPLADRTGGIRIGFLLYLFPPPRHQGRAGHAGTGSGRGQAAVASLCRNCNPASSCRTTAAASARSSKS